MKLVKLNTALITTALQQHEHIGTPVPFNTSFHPASDAPDLTRPSETPYSFKRWLPLILRSRQQTTLPTQLSSSTSPPPPPTAPTPATAASAAATPQSARPTCPPLQTIRLTRPQTKLLLAATEASLPLRQVNRLFREDLAEELAPLLHSTLIFPPQGLFLRLDECSPKDGAGPMVLRSVGDVLGKLVTSVRARNALVHFLNPEREGGDGSQGAGGKEDEAQGLELFFLPFDGRMASEREYRVFCRPGDGRVCGISQYRWYRAWRFQGLGEAEQERVVRRVVEGAGLVRGMILEEVAKGGTEEDKLMLEQGFSFDLFHDEETDGCSLVELNTFGVRSACGSCLFQWVEDRKVLYGEEEAQFRVSVDMQEQDEEERPAPTVRVSRFDGTEGSSKSSNFGGQDWRGFLRAF